MQSSKKKSFFFVLLCIICWAFIPVVSKFGQVNLDNYQFLFWSNLFSAITLLGCTIIFKRLKEFFSYSLSQIIISLFLGFLGTCLYYLLLYFAYAYAKGLEVLTLQYTWPIFVTIFSILILKEKVAPKTLIATLVGFCGIVIIISKGNPQNINLGDIHLNLLVILAASIFGLFSVLSKKFNYEPITFTTYCYISGILFSFIALNIFSKFVLPSPHSLSLIAINGVLINGFSYIFWILALKYGEASFVAPFVFLTPVIAAFLIVIFWGEPVLPIYFVGFVLVILGGLLSK